MLPAYYIPARTSSNRLSSSSWKLFVPYVVDWIIVVVLAAVGGILNHITGYRRPFALTDQSISYPLIPNTVSIVTVGFVAFLVPAVLIILLGAVLPLPGASRRGNGNEDSGDSGKPAMPHSPWRSKISNTHIGLLGLALSLAGTFFITTGLKDLTGKPRPDLIARCVPDLTAIARHVVGGLGQSLDGAPVLVDPTICTQANTKVLDDGFASFPSGHSSFSWAGLGYFSLWLAARFSAAFPHMERDWHQQPPFSLATSSSAPEATAAWRTGESPGFPQGRSSVPRMRAPIHLWRFVVVSIPIVVALFICASRYSDYHHPGFDIISGSIIGASFALLSFRMYHGPLDSIASLQSSLFYELAQLRQQPPPTLSNHGRNGRGGGGGGGGDDDNKRTAHGKNAAAVSAMGRLDSSESRRPFRSGEDHQFTAWPADEERIDHGVEPYNQSYELNEVRAAHMV